VDAHGAEVRLEARFHEGPHLRGQRIAARRQRSNRILRRCIDVWYLRRRSLNGRRGVHTHDLIRDTIRFLFILILRAAHRQLRLQQATQIRVAESLYESRKWRESRRRDCGRSVLCGRIRRCALLSGAHQATVSPSGSSFAALAAAHAATSCRSQIVGASRHRRKSISAPRALEIFASVKSSSALARVCFTRWRRAR